MTDFKRINAKLDKLNEAKATQVNKAQAKLENARRALTEATKAKETAYNDENEQAYTKAKRQEEESAALIEMYTKKLASAQSIPVDYTEVIKDAKAVTRELVEDAQATLRGKLAEIDKIIDDLYRAVIDEETYLEAKICACDEVKLTNTDRFMKVVRGWNTYVRTKAIYGDLADMHIDPSTLGKGTPTWHPNKH